MTNALALTETQQAMLAGEDGQARAMAMRIITRVARATGARRLRPITGAHIDGCIYSGGASLDFALHLLDLGARVSVPTTSNVGLVDLRRPALFRGDAETDGNARKLMDAYRQMGCEPTWTCAPYQLPARPAPGEHVAWGESNAIVFANSVLGARTERYGDFIDMCAALVGLVPDTGLHRDEHRVGQVVFDAGGLSERLLGSDILYPTLGHVVGTRSDGQIPVILGLPAGTGEDRLKALGASAASSGSVALFHAVGVTPEAPTLEDALGGGSPLRTITVSAEMVRDARDALTGLAPGAALDAVCLGTPHFSVREFEQLDQLIRELSLRLRVPTYVSTGRWMLDEAKRRGLLASLERAGVILLTDTCTYNTRILDPDAKAVMTNSGKWAYYAPGNIGVTAALGDLRECLVSAAAGRLVREEASWA